MGTGEAHEATGDAVVPEHMQLLLPSSLPLALQQSAGLLSLMDKEFWLRHAQADDALIALQQSLCVCGICNGTTSGLLLVSAL